MSKRGGNADWRNARDWHPTPYAALVPLLRALRPGTAFCEPCAGDGRLVRWLEEAGHPCILQADLHPLVPEVERRDALTYRPPATVITNPPFSWALLDPLLCHWRDCRTPAILLLPFDQLCNLRFAPHAVRVNRIMPVGRVRWVEGTSNSGMENYAWIRFSPVCQHVIQERKRG